MGILIYDEIVLGNKLSELGVPVNITLVRQVLDLLSQEKYANASEKVIRELDTIKYPTDKMFHPHYGYNTPAHWLDIVRLLTPWECGMVINEFLEMWVKSGLKSVTHKITEEMKMDIGHHYIYELLYRAQEFFSLPLKEKHG